MCGVIVLAPQRSGFLAGTWSLYGSVRSMPDASLPFAGTLFDDPEGGSRAVRDWLSLVSGKRWLWYAKRLAANDTLATGAHQAGFYLPRAFVRQAFPLVSARHGADLNPDTWLALRLDSHGVERDVRLVWYNNRVVSESGTRDEARVTNLGGQESPLLDPDSTGGLLVLAFELELGADCKICRAWLCTSWAEEIAVEDAVGPVEPGAGIVHAPGRVAGEIAAPGPQDCRITPEEFPPSWRGGFPSAEALVAQSVERLAELRLDDVSADDRLMRRRSCEFDLFKSLEEYHVLPRIRSGFGQVQEFVDFANEVTNRRKSRSGRSLELQAAAIFDEDQLRYSRGEISEGNKRPDFLFPSAAAYHDAGYPAARLRMLAAKTTCKDRWRQILNEADRIHVRFLLTLQEGVSVNQWREMDEHHVVLVVPTSLHGKFPEAVRPNLLSLRRFIEETAQLVVG